MSILDQVKRARADTPRPAPASEPIQAPDATPPELAAVVPTVASAITQVADVPEWPDDVDAVHLFCLGLNRLGRKFHLMAQGMRMDCIALLIGIDF